MSSNPHQVTRDFEAAIARYTGAPYCVAVNSCTMALLLAVRWFIKDANQFDPKVARPEIEIPKRTYVGVPMSIMHAGGWPTFRDEDWAAAGYYRLAPLPVWDSARRLNAGLFRWFDSDPGAMVCLSFHATKTLGIEQGGAILLADPAAVEWLRRMRFDGRTAGLPVASDPIREIGWHCYMNPSTAAQGLMRMAGLKADNPALPWDDYPDLSLMEIFQ